MQAGCCIARTFFLLSQGLEGKKSTWFPPIVQNAFSLPSVLDLLGKLQSSEHGEVVEGRGSYPLFCPQEAERPSFPGPQGWPRQAEGQMADGRPRQCYREMMIRLQGLGWWRETREACRFSPHYNHCSNMDLCHAVGRETGLGGLCWQSVFRREEIREIRRAGNQEAFKENCLPSQCHVLGLTQPLTDTICLFNKGYIMLFK